MSVWLEIHCDALYGKCQTHCGESNGMLALNNFASMQRAYNTLAKISLKQGWIKIGKKWACSHCIKEFKRKQNG